MNLELFDEFNSDFVPLLLEVLVREAKLMSVYAFLLIASRGL